MTDSDEPEPGERDGSTAEAVRVLVLFGVSLLVAGGALVFFLLGGRDDGGDTVEAEPATVVADVGPQPGRPVAEVLATDVPLDGRVVAVVSFDRYLTPDDADELLAGDDLAAERYLVATPGGSPTVTADPAEAVAAQVADAEAQLVELEGLIPTVDDPEFVEFYETELIRFRQVVDGAGEPVVFGVVVRAPGPAVRALASRAGIRAVSAAPGADLATDAAVRGLRPEETETTGEPAFRPPVSPSWGRRRAGQPAAGSSCAWGGAGHSRSPRAMRARSPSRRPSRWRRMWSATSAHTASRTHWPSWSHAPPV